MKNESLIKMAMMYLAYFIYSYIVGSISFLTGNAKLFLNFVLDLVFLFGIVFMYRKRLKEDFERIKNNYSKRKILAVVFGGVFAIFVLNIVMGAVTSMLFPTFQSDENTEAILSLANNSLIYTVFKTMIFGVVAEELLFRETLNSCIKENKIYIVFSAIMYCLMNLIFSSGEGNMLISAAIYFIPALLCSYIYVRNNRNIVLLMMIKFIYDLVPLSLLFVELYSK